MKGGIWTAGVSIENLNCRSVHWEFGLQECPLRVKYDKVQVKGQEIVSFEDKIYSLQYDW